jgi:gamma-glutamyltranspeptidase
MIAEFKDNSGIITEEDFRSYKSIIRKDDEVIYADLGNGIRGCGPPPVNSSIKSA